MIVQLILFGTLSAQAQVYSDNSKQILYKRDDVSKERSLSKRQTEPKRKTKIQKAGNLPIYFARSSAPASRAVISPSELLFNQMPGLMSGDMLEAVIPHSIIAFPEEKAPVLAVVSNGKFRGARLIGFSGLEPNSKRIFIEFTKITFKKQTAKVVASGLTEAGQPGFEGEYHSQEAKYFAGDFLASMTAAYFDSQVPRYQSLLGQVEDTSTKSAVKKGLAAGSKSGAERFREKLKKAPEFSVLSGSQYLHVLIMN